jgi:predicted secreted protein
MIRSILVGAALLALSSCGAVLKMNYPVVEIVESDASSLWGDTIRVTLQNTGAGGSVIFYVKQKGKDKCIRQTYMRRDERRKIRIDCSQLSSGTFKMRAGARSLMPKEIKRRAMVL